MAAVQDLADVERRLNIGLAVERAQFSARCRIRISDFVNISRRDRGSDHILGSSTPSDFVIADFVAARRFTPTVGSATRTNRMNRGHVTNDVSAAVDLTALGHLSRIRMTDLAISRIGAHRHSGVSELRTIDREIAEVTVREPAIHVKRRSSSIARHDRKV